MTLSIRRVVTGHDANGKSVVDRDEISTNLSSGRKGQNACVIWTTDSTPDDLTREDDAGLKEVGTVNPEGTVLRIVEYQPGVAPRNHRTDSIDYGIVLSGELDMALDDTVVHLKAGDVVVQRGTIHNWVNPGTEPCVVAFVLIHTPLPSVAGRQLDSVG